MARYTLSSTAAFLAALFLLLPGTAFADETLSLGSPTSDASDNIVNGSRHAMAASFSPTADAVSETIHIKIFNNQDSPPTGTYTVSLQGDNAGEPDGVAIDSVTTNKNTLPIQTCATVAYTNIDLTAPLSGGTTYWVVIVNNTLATYLQVCDDYSTPSVNFQWDDGAGWYAQNAASLTGSIDLVAGGGGAAPLIGLPTAAAALASTTPLAQVMFDMGLPIVLVGLGFLIGALIVRFIGGKFMGGARKVFPTHYRSRRGHKMTFRYPMHNSRGENMGYRFPK